MPFSRKLGFYFIIALINIAAFFLIIKIADYAAIAMSPANGPARMADAGDKTSISTFDIYPYTGGHTQAYANLDRHNWSGDHGFFVDFDLDVPPPKAENELRLILTGGSGAVGWGAFSNFEMLYRRLERMFNETRPCGPDKWLRVVNLAMGGSQSYQNFVALNRWAHPLRPDLILSYSGHNDFFVPLDNRSDAFNGFRTPTNLIAATRFANSPDWLKRLAEVFPGLIKHTDLGLALRILASDPTVKLGPTPSYLAKYPEVPAGPFDIDGTVIREVTEQVASPLYQHAMASIARDFPATPILVVSQAYMLPLDKGLDKGMGVIMPIGEYLENYSIIWSHFRKSFIENGNAAGQFHFMDFNKYYRENLMERFDPGDGVHLNGDQAAELATFVSGPAFDLLCRADAAEPDGAEEAAAAIHLFPGAQAPDPGPRVLVGTKPTALLRLDGGDIAVLGGTAGTAEQIDYDDPGFRVSGWTMDRDGQALVVEVLVLAEGHLIGRATPDGPATEAPGQGEGARRRWRLTIPRDGSLRGTLSFYAVMSDGTARQLQVAPDFHFATDRPAG